MNVVLHVLGLAFALLGMRPGTPGVPLEERTAYLAGRPLAWSLGWIVWMLCALSLVWFMALVAHLRPHTTLAALLAAGGAAVDLTCDALYVTLIPELASAGATPLFLALERALGVAGLVVANGLYSVAVLLVTLTLRKVTLRLLGIGTFAAGMVMVAAGFLGSPRLLELSTGPTVVLFLAWSVGLGRDMSRADPEA